MGEWLIRTIDEEALFIPVPTRENGTILPEYVDKGWSHWCEHAVDPPGGIRFVRDDTVSIGMRLVSVVPRLPVWCQRCRC